MKPSNAFGEDASPALTAIAEQVRGLNPRALPTEQYQDVIDVLEFLRDENLRRYDLLNKRSGELTAEADRLAKLDRDIKLRLRAVEASAGIVPKKRYFWR